MFHPAPSGTRARNSKYLMLLSPLRSPKGGEIEQRKGPSPMIVVLDDVSSLERSAKNRHGLSFRWHERDNTSGECETRGQRLQFSVRSAFTFASYLSPLVPLVDLGTTRFATILILFLAIRVSIDDIRTYMRYVYMFIRLYTYTRGSAEMAGRMVPISIGFRLPCRSTRGLWKEIQVVPLFNCNFSISIFGLSADDGNRI